MGHGVGASLYNPWAMGYTYYLNFYTVGPLKLMPEVSLADRGQIWAENVQTGS